MKPDRTNAVIVGSLAVVIAATFGIAAVQDRTEARSPGWDKPPTPYEACLLAASDPGPSGFATEVCDPLADWFVHPASIYPADFAGRDDRCLTFSWRQVHGGGEGPDVRYCPSPEPDAS